MSSFAAKRLQQVFQTRSTSVPSSEHAKSDLEVAGELQDQEDLCAVREGQHQRRTTRRDEALISRSESTQVNTTHCATSMRLMSALLDTSYAEQPPPQQVPEPDEEHKRYHRKVAKELVDHVLDKTSKGVFEDPVRRADVRTRVVDGIRLADTPEGKSSAADHQTQSAICERLREVIAGIKTKEANTTEGRKQKHFLFQALADPHLGSDDPLLPLIAKELGIPTKTLRTCADERASHPLGYVPPTLAHKGGIEPWVIEVSTFSLFFLCSGHIACSQSCYGHGRQSCSITDATMRG
jgi:hypothetical protein